MRNCIIQHDPDGTNNDGQHDQQTKDQSHYIPAWLLRFTDMHEEEELNHKLKSCCYQNDTQRCCSAHHVIQNHYQRDNGQDNGQNEADDIGLE